MPKKATKTREKNQAGKVLAGEGAPPPQSFSLADFVTALPSTAAPRGGQGQVAREDFPGLASPAPSSPAPATLGSWATPAPLQSAPKVTAPVAGSCPGSGPVAGSTAGAPAPSKAVPDYVIGKTKKGGLPLRVESRGKGKKVTVVFNVSGDLKLLLSELKQAAGSGGVVREDTVEIQGDKMDFVEKWIKNKTKK